MCGMLELRRCALHEMRCRCDDSSDLKKHPKSLDCSILSGAFFDRCCRHRLLFKIAAVVTPTPHLVTRATDFQLKLWGLAVIVSSNQRASAFVMTLQRTVIWKKRASIVNERKEESPI